jgi:hypothetical protein
MEAMQMRRIITAIFLTFTLAMASCSSLTHVPTTATTQTIVTKSISAMNQIKSFNLDTDITNTYKITGSSRTDTTEWKGTKLINVSNQEMGMNMTIPEEISGSNINATLEMYFKEGKEYLKTLATGLYQQNPWTVTQLDDILWKHETQIPYLTEILKNSIQFSLLDNEKINGIDCYVLTVNPSIQSAIDFAVSQEQPFGTQIDTMSGGGIPVVRPDAYQSSSIKLWIDRNSNLPVKVEVNIDFQGNVGGGMITSTPYTPTTNPVDSSFQGQLNFSNYNQAVSIQVPEEALGAK